MSSPAPKPKLDLSGPPSAKGQAFFQNLLLLTAFVCVPWMLVPKPLILKKRHEAAMKARGGAHGAVRPGCSVTALSAPFSSLLRPMT